MAEYKYKTKRCGDYGDLEKCLNEYAQLGYRVFQIFHICGYVIIFEKEVKDDEQ